MNEIISNTNPFERIVQEHRSTKTLLLGAILLMFLLIGCTNRNNSEQILGWNETLTIQPEKTGVEKCVMSKAIFVPGGEGVLLNGVDEVFWLYSFTARKPLAFKGHTDCVQSIDISSNGSQVVTTSSDQTIRLWSTKTGKELFTLTQLDPFGLWFAKLSPNGDRVIGNGDKRGVVRVWSTESGKEIMALTGHIDENSGRPKTVFYGKFSPDGRYILTGTAETVHIWSADTGEEIAVLGRKGLELLTAEFSPNSTRIVTAAFEKNSNTAFTARIWSAETGEELSILRGHSQTIHDAQFNQEGNRVVTYDDDAVVRVWSAKSGKNISILDVPDRFVNSVQFSPNGKFILTSTSGKFVRVWSAKSGKELAALPGDEIAARIAKFNSDGTKILSVSKYGKTARVWSFRFED